MSVPKSLLKMALKMYTVSYRQHSNIFFIICYYYERVIHRTIYSNLEVGVIFFFLNYSDFRCAEEQTFYIIIPVALNRALK